MSDAEYFEKDDSPRGFPWYILTGLIIGLSLGALISFVLSPVRHINTSPSSLADEYKADYRLIIAQAFTSNQDPVRASQRLALLGDDDALTTLSKQAQLLLTNGEEASAKALAILASSLGNLQLVQADPTVQPAQETVLPEESPTLQRPSESQTTTLPDLTQTALYVLVDSQSICEAGQPALLQVEIRSSDGNPAPGVQISIAWDGGLDTFFTGLKPDMGEGYADFQMTPGVLYSLRAGNSATVNDLIAPVCTDANGNPFEGGLRLVFGQ